MRASAASASNAGPLAEVTDVEPDLETVPRKLDRPLLEHASGDPRRFVFATLVAVATLLLAVLAFDVVVDPWGQLGTFGDMDMVGYGSSADARRLAHLSVHRAGGVRGLPRLDADPAGRHYLADTAPDSPAGRGR